MRLAVLLNGQLRLWVKAAPYLFKYFESQSYNVDYYLASWNTTRTFWWPEEHSIHTNRPVLDTEITDIFHQYGKTLIDYQLVDQIKREPMTYFYFTWLSKLTNLMKRRHEWKNNFVYDQVVEVRPDLYIAPSLPPWRPCEEYQYVSGGMALYTDKTNGHLYHNDFYYRSTSWSNDVLSNRGLNKPNDKMTFTGNSRELRDTPTDNHQLLSEWILKRKITECPSPIDYLYVFIIRPNFPNDLNVLDREQLITLNDEWIKSQWASPK